MHSTSSGVRIGFMNVRYIGQSMNPRTHKIEGTYLVRNQLPPMSQEFGKKVFESQLRELIL